MKIQTLLGLCLSGTLLFAGSATMADDNKSNNRSARAVQVQLDKEGRKVAPAESDAAVISSATTTTASADNSELSKIMPEHNSDVQHNSDGSMSAQLGSENLQYVVMTIDEDGKKSVKHVTAEKLESISMDEPAESEVK